MGKPLLCCQPHADGVRRGGPAIPCSPVRARPLARRRTPAGPGRFSPLAVLCLLTHTGLAAEADQADPALELVPIVITARGTQTLLTQQPGNTSRLETEDIILVRPTHASELLTRAPGVWINRGSGQEHLTAIRSPVLTGAGSCGAFLVAENGFSIRPAGFCNVNQLLEVNTEQADAVEVIRGPGSALYGSNALHGVINVLSGPADPRQVLGLEIGADGYARGSLDLGGNVGRGFGRALVAISHDDGWRDDSAYDQQKLNLAHESSRGSDSLRLALAATNLDQQTAGFIIGQDAYKDPDLSRSNLDPEAFRVADSQRLSASWEHRLDGGELLSAGAILRRSRMEFLQHFLPGQPLERNGQQSAGFRALWRSSGIQVSRTLGVELELSDGFLWEYQSEPITQGSEFLRETRPAGLHYDYSVLALTAAPFAQLEWQPQPGLMLSAGLRYEYQRYDYDNHMLSGNTDENGLPCGFGGCLFNRPKDRSDDFSELAPKFGLLWGLSAGQQVYVTLNRGFRAPQATELYRLQAQQTVAELKPETLDALELGYRLARPGLFLELAGFHMRKRHVIFRDSEGFNVSDGSTRHQGVELDASWGFAKDWALGVNGTWALHRYDFDRLASQGELIQSGNDVDTSPKTLGSLRLAWTYSGAGKAELEWAHMGKYYLDAQNDHSYPGHDLLNLRLRHLIAPDWILGLNLNNLADRAYAERADFAFGNYRYFPGRGRSVFLSLEWHTG